MIGYVIIFTIIGVGFGWWQLQAIAAGQERKALRFHFRQLARPHLEYMAAIERRRLPGGDPYRVVELHPKRPDELYIWDCSHLDNIQTVNDLNRKLHDVYSTSARVERDESKRTNPGKPFKWASGVVVPPPALRIDV